MILMDTAFLQELGHFLLDEDDNVESSDESEKNLMTVVKAARKTQACFLLSHWKTRVQHGCVFTLVNCSNLLLLCRINRKGSNQYLKWCETNI